MCTKEYCFVVLYFRHFSSSNSSYKKQASQVPPWFSAPPTEQALSFSGRGRLIANKYERGQIDEKSLIHYTWRGRSITSHQWINILFRSSQPLPCLSLRPLKGSLCCPRALQRRLTFFQSYIWNYRAPRTQSGAVVLCNGTKSSKFRN